MSIETNPRIAPPAALTVEAVRELIDREFPGIHADGRSIEIEAVAPSRARCRLTPGPAHIRPGGTISGPSLFLLADFTIYVALIGTIGAPAIPAVTSNLNINFLARPEAVDLVAEATLLRIGRRLAFAEVTLRPAGGTTLVAHATGSYALALRVG